MDSTSMIFLGRGGGGGNAIQMSSGISLKKTMGISNTVDTPKSLLAVRIESLQSRSKLELVSINMTVHTPPRIRFIALQSALASPYTATLYTG